LVDPNKIKATDDQRDLISQYFYACLLAGGSVTGTPDRSAAIPYLKAAADQSDPSAINDLGVAFASEMEFFPIYQWLRIMSRSQRIKVSLEPKSIPQISVK
jgi:hypothetical protein